MCYVFKQNYIEYIIVLGIKLRGKDRGQVLLPPSTKK